MNTMKLVIAAAVGLSSAHVLPVDSLVLTDKNCALFGLTCMRGALYGSALASMYYANKKLAKDSDFSGKPLNKMAEQLKDIAAHMDNVPDSYKQEFMQHELEKMQASLTTRDAATQVIPHSAAWKRTMKLVARAAALCAVGLGVLYCDAKLVDMFQTTAELPHQLEYTMF